MGFLNDEKNIPHIQNALEEIWDQIVDIIEYPVLPTVYPGKERDNEIVLHWANNDFVLNILIANNGRYRSSIFNKSTNEFESTQSEFLSKNFIRKLLLINND